MYDFIHGIAESKEPGHVVINCNGLGYGLDIPISIGEKIETGKEIRLYAHLIIRDDTATLYGFIDIAQRKVFRNIIAVSGIGPRLALNILGVFTLDQLAAVVQGGDVSQLTRVPKLGSKKAQHLITELEGRLPSVTVVRTPILEAETALITLGYKKQEATIAINNIKGDGLSTEQLVKHALQNLRKSP